MNPLSGVIGEAWRMYKAFARHLLAIAFVIYLAAAIISALLALIGTVGFYLGTLVSLVAGYLLQATLVKAVQDVRDGRADLSIGETVSAATPYLWSVIGASILAGIAIIIGLILVIVPGLYLITIWAVIIPVIVIERAGVFASFGRSRELVRGRGWHVFATLVLLWVIQLVAGIVLGLIFSALPHALRGGLSSVISGTLIAPFVAVVVTLVYYRLVGSAAPAGGAPYGAYQGSPQEGGPYGGYQPPQDTAPYGGYQPPQGGGYQPPQDAGSYQPPPQDAGSSEGHEPPTRQVPRYGGYEPPPQDGGT
jgi:hypothetical protein